MAKPKEKKNKLKRPGAKTGSAPKALMRRGADRTGDKAHEQLKDAADDHAERPEQYGADGLEQGISHIAHSGEQAVKNIGDQAKEKVSDKVKSRLSGERVPENSVREADAYPDAEPVRGRDVWQQPRTDLEKPIKTKESYRAQVMEMPLVKEKPQSRPDATKVERVYTLEKPEAVEGSRPAYSGTRIHRDVEDRPLIREKSQGRIAMAEAESFHTAEHYKPVERTNQPLRYDTRIPQRNMESGVIKQRQRIKPSEAETILPQANTASAEGGKPAYAFTHTYRGGKDLAEAQAQKRVRERVSYPQSFGRVISDSGKNTVKAVDKGTIKTASKSTVKTTETAVKATGKTVKIAQKSADTTARTVKATAKTTQKTAKAAAKAAKAAAETAAKAAKVAAKAAATAFKAIATALKGLIAAIAAGGWVAVVIIVALALVALLLCSAFGLFSSNETEDGSKPTTAAITQIDMEFKTQIDRKIEHLSAGGCDAVVVEYRGDMDGDSAFLNNWNDVLATYAVLLTTNETMTMDVVTVTPEKVEKLREIFRKMNTVEYDTEVQTETYIVETEDGEEEEIAYSTLYIYITVKSLDYIESAALYHMTDKQFEVLDAMMSPEFAALFAELIGVDVYGGTNLTDILSGLPASGKGAEVVRAALAKLGAPYVLGAKGENRFDCSGFVYWAIKQVDPVLGSRMYTSAAGQAKYCFDRGLAVGELMPGDLVFWQNLSCEGCSRWNEVHHVGIYIGNGKVIEASSSQGRVIIRDLWDSTNYPLFMYARPYN
ncbi:MAG TPA: C40 family peptidase [Clostridia bacterium]|nr:C40 family peptidase [Clostridia bacterium]